MIDNTNKVAVVFGVRNDSSIAFSIAMKLHQSGCKVALNYVEDTKEEVLVLILIWLTKPMLETKQKLPIFCKEFIKNVEA
jgi:enoyl-[acyl-carrier-protein] reductase (NADH)